MKKVILLVAAMGLTIFSFAKDIKDGKVIFSTRCNACHAIDKNIVGPALMGLDKRRDEKWIISFVHSSQSVIKSGDTAASALFNRFNKTVMPDHRDLTDDQIKSIIQYVKTETVALGSIPKKEIKKPGVLVPVYTPVQWKDYGVWFSLFSTISLLVGSLLTRIKVEELKGR